MADLVAVLAAGDPLAQAFSQALWLARLQRRHPCYDVWLDQRYGRDARYVAQRRPGVSGRPYAVVTTDPAELDAALTHGGGARWSGSPDQRIGG
jgi:hypothetical protein